MKILILGNKGMLGRDLQVRLGAGHDVLGRDIEDFDLASPEDCRRVVAEIAPEVVINAAAYTNVDGAEAERERCFAVNALGVGNIARACRGRRITLVHFSTDYVFDGSKASPYTEDDQPSPLNAYGASKLEGERLLQEYADQYLLVRTAWLYGRHGRNFVRTILEKAASQGELEVVDDQVGSPTCTWDLAGAVELLLLGGHRGLFHVTSRGWCSWFEFARKILEYAGMREVLVRPINSQALSRPARRPVWSVLSSAKFSAAVGRVMPMWQIALSRFLEGAFPEGFQGDRGAANNLDTQG